ncbi:MAG: putative secreted protein, partial [uncultured Blastococcus sp.]
ALVHRRPDRRRSLRHGRGRLRHALRAHPVDPAALRRPGPGPGLGAAPGAAPLRSAHDRRAALEAGLGGRSRRAGAGLRDQHRRQPGRVRRRAGHVEGARAADGPARGVRARQQRLLRPAAEEPAEVLQAEPQAGARRGAAVARPARRHARPGLAGPHQRGRRAHRGRTPDRVRRGGRLPPEAGPLRRRRRPGGPDRRCADRFGALARAAGARPVRRRPLRPAAVRAHPRRAVAGALLRGTGDQLRHRPRPGALAAPLGRAGPGPSGRHLAARLGGARDQPVRTVPVRLSARGDAAHLDGPRRL